MADKFDPFRDSMGQEFVDNFLALFGMGPKAEKTEPVHYICPKCGSQEAQVVEIHADTDMNEIVGRCPVCNYESDTKEFKKVEEK